MQEKRVHIDDKFTDQAWTNMRSLLDRELPESEVRHRGVAWWWALVAVLVVVAGTAIWFFGKTEKSNKLRTNQPIAMENNSGEEVSNENIANSTSSAIDKSNAEENLNNGGAGSGNVSKPIISNHRLITRKSHPSQIIHTKTTNPYNSTNILIEQPTLAIKSPKQNSSDKKQETLVLTPIIESREAFALEKIGDKNLLALERQTNGKAEVAFTFPKEHKWTWSLIGNGLCISNFTGIGVEAGAMVERKLSNSLSLGTGVSYNYLRQPIYTGTSATLVSETGGKVIYENANLAAEDVFDPNLDNVESKTLQLHYLNFPLSINYNFGKRWDANLGGSLGLLLTSSSIYVRDGLLNIVGFNSNELKSSNTTLAKVSLTDFAITGGIGFRVNRTWSLQLNYVHGVKDILPDNIAGDYNRLLKFGFRYKLNSSR